MVAFREYHYWSIYHDAEVVRVSVPDSHGREFFQIVVAEGRGYAERRSRAVEACLEAIAAGCSPGMVL